MSDLAQAATPPAGAPVPGDDQVKNDFVAARALASKPDDSAFLAAAGAAGPATPGTAAPAAVAGAPGAPAPAAPAPDLERAPLASLLLRAVPIVGPLLADPTVQAFGQRLGQAAVGGAGQSLKDLAAAADATGYQAPTADYARPLGWADLRDPATAAAKSVYQIAHGAPVLAAGIAGAAAGGALTSETGPGAAVGALGGGALASGAMSAAQSVGPYYAAALKANPADPSAALDQALKQAATDGVFSAAGWAAFGFAPFKSAVGNLLLQAFGVQPAIGAAATAAQNVEAGRPAGEGVAASIPGSIIGTALPALGMAAVRRLTNGGEAAPETPPVPPGQTPPPAPPGAPGAGGTTAPAPPVAPDASAAPVNAPGTVAAPTIIDRSSFLAMPEDANGARDFTAWGDQVRAQVQGALDAGRSVTLVAGGKPVPIVGVGPLGLLDAEGKPWGTMLIATSKDGADRIELGGVSAVSSAPDASATSSTGPGAEPDAGAPPGGANPDPFAGFDDDLSGPTRDWLRFGDTADPVTISPEIERQADDYLKGKTGDNPVKINLDYIGSGDDVAAALQHISSMLPAQAVQSNDSTQVLAASLGLRPEQLLAGYQGQQLDAAQTTAMRFMLDSSAGQLIQYARGVAAGGEQAAAQFLRAFSIHQGLQQYFENARAEAGRTLQAYQIMTRQTAQATQAVSDLIRNVGADNVQKLAGQIADLSDPVKVSQYVAKARQLTGRDLFLNGFYNVMLSNIPKILIKKGLSDATTALWNVAVRYTAAKLGSGAVAPSEAAALAYGYASAIQDGLRLAWQGIQTGERQFANGVRTLDVAPAAPDLARMAAGRPDANMDTAGREMGAAMVQGPNPAPKPMQAADGAPPALTPDQPTRSIADYLRMALPSRWLGAADDLAQYMNYRAELRALAFRDAWQHGLDPDNTAQHVTDLMNTVPDALHQQARAAALRNAYVEPLTGFSQKLADAADAINIPVPGVNPQNFAIPLGRMVLPFVRIASNMAATVYRNSPLAAAFPSAEIRADFAAGGARRDLMVTRIALGSAVGLAAGAIAAGSQLTGRGPSDPSLNRAWRAAGNQPYSITIGGKPYGYNQLDPIGMYLGAIGDTADTLKFAHDQSRGDIASSLAFGLGNAMLSKTYLSSLGDLFTALQQPERDASTYVDRFLGSLAVPSGVAAVDKATDPWLRAHYSLLDSVMARTPIASEHLPAARTLWGDAIPAQQAFLPALTGTGLARAESPIPVGAGAAAAEPIDTWIWKNRDAFPHADDGRLDLYKPGPVQSYAAPGGKISAQVQLSPQQLDRLQVLAGNGTKDPATGLGAKDLLNALVTGDRPGGLSGPQAARVAGMQRDWAAAPPARQAAELLSIAGKFKDAAKKQLLNEDGALADTVRGQWAVRAQQLTGATP